MKILFLCTAHNSLSQRLFLVLSRKHSVTIEYALSQDAIIEAAELVKPSLIICPFLTSMVPQQVYDTYLTLIIHPGPPGDAGPSALDWLLMGDDGTQPDSEQLLRIDGFNQEGRSYWGVTVLQATGEFDAGPVWAFDQFPIDINDMSVTKSSLYRGPVTQAAIAATLAAVERIESASALTATAFRGLMSPPASPGVNEARKEAASPHIFVALAASKEFAEQAINTNMPFLGGQTRHRPLLKAAQRDFDIKRHSAAEISRRIRSSDSQPGCLSSIFGPKLYLYGGVVEDPTLLSYTGRYISPGSVIAVRDEAVCIATSDNKGIWITHIRRVKAKTDTALWPKVPAVSGLKQLNINVNGRSSWCHSLLPQTHSDEWSRSYHSTFQEIWVDFVTTGSKRLAHLYFDFYNGAMSTPQCQRLVRCIDYIVSKAADPNECLPLAAVVFMGGSSYFSNGIHLNVIEAAEDPSLESWCNINAINDVVEKILRDLPARGITTIAAIRGNSAAGGVALATACDIVLAGEDVVLNPAYRAVGLFGSEFHTVSYPGRCGAAAATNLLRSMTPLSAADAHRVGLVDHVLPYSGRQLDVAVREHADTMFAPDRSPGSGVTAGSWKGNVEITPVALAQARAAELAQMSMDFWSARSSRYHSRRRDFVRKSKPASTPLRFASHRRQKGDLDEEERDDFDSIECFVSRSRREMKKDITDRMVRLINDFTQTDSISFWGQKQAVPSAGPAIGCENSTSVAGSSAGPGTATVFPCYYDS